MSGRTKRTRKRVLVVTGSRAEFGLLRPVMKAVKNHKRLDLRVAVAGEHLLAPALTWKEVAREFHVDAKVPMQRPRDRGRLDHAAACARGMAGFAAAYKRIKPDWVVVLGDRIEAFAAASAGSIAGIAVCHIHGGDRAEGIADEAMRHAITKLSHLHCAATKQSAQRIMAMGERKELVFVTGSPAIDEIAQIKPMEDYEARSFGDPYVLLLMHPSGLCPDWEVCAAHHAYMLARYPRGLAKSTLWLAPNFDAGREIIDERRRQIGDSDEGVTLMDHIPRKRFIALLKRLAKRGGCMIGNSSAGLIEAAAIGLSVVDLGPRQNGREHGPNVLRLLNDPNAYGATDIGSQVDRACRSIRRRMRNSTARRPSDRFGDGRSGPRITALLSRLDPGDPVLLRKRNGY